MKRLNSLALGRLMQLARRKVVVHSPAHAGAGVVTVKIRLMRRAAVSRSSRSNFAHLSSA